MQEMWLSKDKKQRLC